MSKNEKHSELKEKLKPDKMEETIPIKKFKKTSDLIDMARAESLLSTTYELNNHSANIIIKRFDLHLQSINCIDLINDESNPKKSKKLKFLKSNQAKAEINSDHIPRINVCRECLNDQALNEPKNDRCRFIGWRK